MARILFFTILALCLVCLIQGSPVEGQGQQPNIVDDAIHAATALGESIQKAGENVANDPNVKKLVSDVVQTIQQGLEAAGEQISKLAPKTA